MKEAWRRVKKKDGGVILSGMECGEEGGRRREWDGT